MALSASPNPERLPPVQMELAGSLPLFAGPVGGSIAASEPLASFRRKQLLFNRIVQAGQVHVYRADCAAGERLRVQVMVPVLKHGGALAPAVAVVAPGLPYQGEIPNLPIKLPAGCASLIAMPPTVLMAPMKDMLTRATYYPGPVIDSRTLVGGRCYILVWSPQNNVGKYVLQVGHAWSFSWRYWLQVPRFWWQIRGWFGLSRWQAYAALGGAVALGLVARRAMRWWRRRRAARQMTA